VATEIELKLLLADEVAYGVVRSALERLDPSPQVLEQVNYYLDTPHAALRRAGVMVRRRTANGASMVTVKAQPQLAGGVMRVTELERRHDPATTARWQHHPPSRLQLDELQVADWLGEGGVLAEPLAAGTWLHVIGALATTRRVYRLDAVQWLAMAAEPASAAVLAGAGPVQVELDHARYGVGGSDTQRFEIEVEHPQADLLHAPIAQWLDDLGVVAVPADESKYAQLLRLMDRVG
jgi:uncharacterized protein YjbK